MNQQSIKNAYILFLSGGAKLNKYGEMEWVDRDRDFINFMYVGLCLNFTRILFKLHAYI